MENETFETAMGYIEDGYPEAAQPLGAWLRALGDIRGVEILARAHLGLKEHEHAIRLLEASCNESPLDGRLQSLLATAYSESKRFEDAERKFTLLIDDPDFGESATYNIAVVAGRKGEYDRALAILTKMNPTSKYGQALVRGSRVWILHELGEFDRAGEEYAALKSLGLESSTGAIYASLSSKALGDHKQAVAFAWEAVRAPGRAQEAIDLIRELREYVSAEARVFQVSVRGTVKDPDGKNFGFVSSYLVKAASEESAKEFVEPFDHDVTSAIEFDEILRLADPVPEGSDGVLACSPRSYYEVRR